MNYTQGKKASLQTNAELAQILNLGLADWDFKVAIIKNMFRELKKKNYVQRIFLKTLFHAICKY